LERSRPDSPQQGEDETLCGRGGAGQNHLTLESFPRDDPTQDDRSTMPATISEPRLRRSISLQLQGDGGQANLHRICGWLSQELLNRCGPFTRISIVTGRGMLDAVRAVGRGQVGVALAVPTAFVPMTLAGTGIARGEACPDVRALGTMPQDDRLVFAIKAEHGIRSFDDLRRKAPKLRIATHGTTAATRSATSRIACWRSRARRAPRSNPGADPSSKANGRTTVSDWCNPAWLTR